jgi:putative membrane protein
MTVLRPFVAMGSVLVAGAACLPTSLAQSTVAPPPAPGRGAGQDPKGAPAPAAPQTTPQRTVARLSDVDFVRRTAAGNRFEIEAARIAIDKAGNEKVKDLAEKLALDHDQIIKELGKSSVEAGVAMPSAFMPDTDQQARLDALKTKSGTEFDSLFLSEMVKAHDDSVALLTLYVQVGTNTKLQAFAAKVLPTVQKHRDMLKQM